MGIAQVFPRYRPASRAHVAQDYRPIVLGAGSPGSAFQVDQFPRERDRITGRGRRLVAIMASGPWLIRPLARSTIIHSSASSLLLKPSMV